MPPIIKPIRGVPGYYVGTNGMVWSRWKLRGRADGRRGTESYISNEMSPIKLRDHNNGYLQVALRKDGKYLYFLVHRLVLETFVSPCPEGMECRHLDGDKRNNRLSNICWGTKTENQADKVRHGTDRAGTEAAAIVNRGSKRVFTEEHKANLAASRTGMKLSASHRAAISAGGRRRYRRLRGEEQ